MERAACDTSMNRHWNDCRCDTSAKIDPLKSVLGGVTGAACDTSANWPWPCLSLSKYREFASLSNVVATKLKV